MGGLFLNLQNLSAVATDDALEYIYKSVGHDHDGSSSWRPHESLLIRKLIELFTSRGLDRMDSVKKEIEAWTLGQRYAPSSAPVIPPPGGLARWNDAELSLVRLYLESLPPALWTLDDHMMAVDYVMQRYLPADALAIEAEWLAVRAGIMGKAQANLDKPPTAKDAEKILAALPSTVAGAAQQFSLSRAEKKALDFCRVRAVENVRALSDETRHKMRSLVLQHLESTDTPSVSRSSLQTKLLDQFGTLNRDWRRIAITEAGEAQLQGLIASLPYGAKVQRIERYEGACAFCRKIDNVIATVVDPAGEKKDSDTEVWVGKNNIGRSASPRKRVGDMLVERDPDELWHLPAGLAHPNCRGRWVVVDDGSAPAAGEDPAFGAWLNEVLAL
jgi:hypothetical protein